MVESAVRIIGLEAAKRLIGRKRLQLANRQIAFKKAVIIIDRWVQKNFQEQGKPVGGWEPLADATIERRRKGPRGEGRIAILQDTSTLKKSFKHVIESDYCALVSGVPYGIFHEKGTSKMPQRRILPKVREVQADIRKVFADFVGSKIND